MQIDEHDARNCLSDFCCKFYKCVCFFGSFLIGFSSTACFYLGSTLPNSFDTACNVVITAHHYLSCIETAYYRNLLNTEHQAMKRQIVKYNFYTVVYTTAINLLKFRLKMESFSKITLAFPKIVSSTKKVDQNNPTNYKSSQPITIQLQANY